MGTLKDRNGKDLIETEEIKKRWQAYTEELCKKHLNDPGNHNDVVTHPEPDILKCEIKWVLENTAASKASGGDVIPAEVFKILKDDAVKVLHSMYQYMKLENQAVPTGLEKVNLHPSFQEGQY